MDGELADISLQKTARTAKRGPGRPFRKGQSGNPKGRPRGLTNHSTRAAAILLDGEAEVLTRKAIELALAGDAAALRLCLDRIVAPRREQPWEIDLPKIRRPADIASAMAALIGAAARGKITAGQAFALSQTIETYFAGAGRQRVRPPDAGLGDRRRRGGPVARLLMKRHRLDLPAVFWQATSGATQADGPRFLFFAAPRKRGPRGNGRRGGHPLFEPEASSGYPLSRA
jgi:Family of unknown function (DUF5681)